jgi:antitoxin Phd
LIEAFDIAKIAKIIKMGKYTPEEVLVVHFSLTDLSNRSGEVVEAAFRGPVEITRRGKRKFMLLTAEDYDRLVSAADTRRAFHADDAPEGVAAMMLAALTEENEG